MALNIPTLPSSAISTPREKVTAEQRNAIYALRHILHVSPDILADVFGLSRVTIHQIASRKNKTYKDVAFVADDIGTEAMYARYVTQDMLDRIDAIARAASPRKAQALQDAERAAAGLPNPKADKHAGELYLRGDNVMGPPGSVATVKIDWQAGIDGNDKPGWYLGSIFPGHAERQWTGNDRGEPFSTSTAAKQWAEDPARSMWMRDTA